MMLRVHQWNDPRSHTRTYVVVDEEAAQALVIDPVRDRHPETIRALLALKVEVCAVVETHVHADHITDALLLQDALERAGGPRPKIIVSARANVSGDVRRVDDGDRIRVGETTLQVLATPGHTVGCLSLVLDAPFVDVTAKEFPRAVFTGDALLIGGCGRTDFQGGDAKTLFHSIRNKLFQLPGETVVYPAHDYRGRSSSTIEEERTNNPRVKDGMTEEAFVALMGDLDLQPPAQIALAVPANERVGKLGPEWSQSALVKRPDGVFEIPSGFIDLETGLGPPGVVLLDTRPVEERVQEGQLASAIVVAFDDLAKEAEQWSRKMPAVTICRRGIRSVEAAKVLVDLGFSHVASLKGGMELLQSQAKDWERIRVLAQG